MQNKATFPGILTYDDLAQSTPGQSREELIDVKSYDNQIVAEYDKCDMESYTGATILVRRTVAKKLAEVNSQLEEHGNRLKIVYGYRHPKVQHAYFTKWKETIRRSRPGMTAGELDKYTHNFIAVPEVAGHPTGGAVDVTVVDQSGIDLDMGTLIADYSDEDKIRTYSTKLAEAQKTNRLLLHDLMTAQGFAPFYGEWWHFSYGDREWAVFYKKKKARYGTINLNFSPQGNLFARD